MKTIVRKHNGLSLYFMPDDCPVVIKETHTEIGNPVENYVWDCTTADVVLHENVSDPGDWLGSKYFFDGTNWTLNPDWVDPRPQAPQE